MNTYFLKKFEGDPFQLFNNAHLSALGIISAIIILIVILKRNNSERWLEVIRYFLVIIIPLNEISWHVWISSLGEWTIKEDLPLHLCSLMIWMSPILLLKKNFRIYEFVYYLGIGGAIQSLITPNLTYYNFPHYRFFQTFIGHGGIFLTAIFLTVADGFRPKKKSGLRVFLIGNVYMIIILILNSIIGSNYMWVSGKPEASSLLDYLGPWPYYIIGIEVMAIITIVILNIPFYRSWFQKEK